MRVFVTMLSFFITRLSLGYINKNIFHLKKIFPKLNNVYIFILSTFLMAMSFYSGLQDYIIVYICIGFIGGCFTFFFGD